MISEVKSIYNVFVAHFYFFCALAVNIKRRVSFLLVTDIKCKLYNHSFIILITYYSLFFMYMTRRYKLRRGIKLMP